jgi:hypothetical protein
MKQIEKEEQTIRNVFPMRNEIIPKHIRVEKHQNIYQEAIIHQGF